MTNVEMFLRRRRFIAVGRREDGRVEDCPARRHPLDRDGDGKPGGSLPFAQRGLDDLIAEAAALGITIDRRYGEARIRKIIALIKDGGGDG